MNSIINELKSNKQFMSVKEGKICELILSSPKDFLNFNLKEVSIKAGVSQGSVINFSNKYARGGFPKLKLLIASSISSSDEFISEKKDDGTLLSLLKETGENYFGAVNNTLSLSNEDDLKTVASLILKAKKVQIYGIYRSAIVANDFYNQLLQLGVPASYVSDVLTCAVSASMLDKNSLIIAVSSTGQTQDVIEAVKIAQQNGVKAVAITANKNSKLATLCDTVLFSSPSGNSSLSAPTEIRISQLAIVDTLCSYVRRKSGDAKKYFEIEEILSMHNVKD